MAGDLPRRQTIFLYHLLGEMYKWVLDGLSEFSANESLRSRFSERGIDLNLNEVIQAIDEIVEDNNCDTKICEWAFLNSYEIIYSSACPFVQEGFLKRVFVSSLRTGNLFDLANELDQPGANWIEVFDKLEASFFEEPQKNKNYSSEKGRIS